MISRIAAPVLAVTIPTFIAYFGIGLLTTGAPLLICMIIFIGGMFAMANLPGKIGRSLTYKMLAAQEHLEADAEKFAEKQLADNGVDPMVFH